MTPTRPTPLAAALPMYDLPELGPANEALWAALARRLRAAGVAGLPDSLIRPDDLHAFWRRHDLLLAQTCGYPLTTALKGAVRVVATPLYAVPGCEGAWHRSVIVVRRDDPADGLGALRGRVAAINARDSNTGMNLFRAALAPVADGRPVFARVIETGAHSQSLRAVAEGMADAAAIDCVTFAHLRRWRATWADAVRVLAETPTTPGLPLITASTTDDATVAALRDALAAVAGDPALADARATLFLTGFVCLPDKAYARVTELAEGAALAGYPELA